MSKHKGVNQRDWRRSGLIEGDRMQILQSKKQDQIENATAMGLLFQAGPSIKLAYLSSSFKSESLVILICIFLMNKDVDISLRVSPPFQIPPLTIL